MGIDIFLAIGDIVVACAVTWFIIQYFLASDRHQVQSSPEEVTGALPSTETDRGDGNRTGAEPAQAEGTVGRAAGRSEAGGQTARSEEAGTDVDGLSHQRRHFIQMTVLSAILTLPVLVIDLLARFSPEAMPEWLASPWIQAILITPVFFYCGSSVITDGWSAIRSHRTDPGLLASLAATVAYVYSLATCLANSLLPEGSRLPYFDVVGVIITLSLFAQALERETRISMVHLLDSLGRIRPEQAHLVEDGTGARDGEEGNNAMAGGYTGVEAHPKTRLVGRSELKTGDVVLVGAGERFPADGRILSGRGRVDASDLGSRGEPALCGQGDRALESTRLTEGGVTLLVEQTGENTYIDRLTGVIRKAFTGRSSASDRVDRIVHMVICLVMIIAVWTFMIWLLVGPQPHLAHAVANAVCVLAISCPMASALAIPLAFRTSLSTGINRGLLFTSPAAMGAVSHTSTVVFDDSSLLQGQTGGDRGDTGTKRKTALVDEAGLTRATTHLRDLNVSTVIFDGAAGPADILAGPEADKATDNHLSDKAQADGQGPRKVPADPSQAIEHAARRAGVDTLITGLTEEGKIGWIKRLIRDRAGAGQGRPEGGRSGEGATVRPKSGPKNGLVAMVAAGREQTGAQAAAQVRVSMGIWPASSSMQGGSVQEEETGTGSVFDLEPEDLIPQSERVGHEPSRSGTDLIIGSGDLDGVGRAVDLARSTRRITNQNLGWSYVYNIVAVVLATGAFYPLVGWMVNPILAPIATAVAVILPMLNVYRLHRLSRLSRRWGRLESADPDGLPTVAANRPRIIVDSRRRQAEDMLKKMRRDPSGPQSA